MSIEYDIMLDKKLVLAKGSGVITGTDVLRHLDALPVDDRYQAPKKKLVDYRSIDDIRISMEEAYAIAQKQIKLAHTFSSERCAFVSPMDVTYGSSRVHQALVDGAGLKTAIFRHIEEALAWLGVTLDMDR